MTTETTNENRRKDDARPAGALTWTDPAPAVAHLGDVMIDIETMGTTPGSAILSIGAVAFGPAGLGDEFYAPIALASCTAAGLTIDPATVAWWMKQSDAARAAAFRDDAEPLPRVLLRFTAWFERVEAERPWCQGANFDAPLLEAAYRACSMTPPWKFWNVRDTRTLYEQADVKVDRARGTHHNALDDARAQAEAAVVALQRLQDAREQRAAQQAAVTPICTCPSGDGSLRWPCPAHPPESADPASPEQVHPIGRLLDEFSALPVLWGLNEPGALVRHGDVFKMLINAGKTYLAVPNAAAPAADAVVQALKGEVPLVEPVYIGKALRAGRKATVCLSGGTGPLACVMLVNIQLTPWIPSPDIARAFAEGYNRSLGDLRHAVLEVAEKDRAAAVDTGGQS